MNLVITLGEKQQKQAGRFVHLPGGRARPSTWAPQLDCGSPAEGCLSGLQDFQREY